MKVSDAEAVLDRLFPHPRHWDLLVTLNDNDDGITLRLGLPCGC